MRTHLRRSGSDSYIYIRPVHASSPDREQTSIWLDLASSVIEHAVKGKIIIVSAGVSALPGKELLSFKNYLDRSFG